MVGNEIWCLGGAASEAETLEPQLMVFNIQRKVWRLPQIRQAARGEGLHVPPWLITLKEPGSRMCRPAGLNAKAVRTQCCLATQRQPGHAFHMTSKALVARLRL